MPVDRSRETRLRAFGARVRSARLERGVSQEVLAHESGLHRTYVGGVERGERNISLASLWAIADALGVDAADLIPKG
ncbi:helix-turn-helix transcriptional regulator [Phycicoccus sp. HDW14]|uniref:helix-turn-helix domain-containing protein n=1 Tax=Phycicoccus sp. HDW14 TaxID=2714941 RepID=UPI0014094633|nr:helix-turn-helix transcriptional regulator [Phycicoccus sp. HDW14]QIM22139.1 helix-turn-helix transcriptional regulator [Phycicoccus sp. HDW14]